MDVSRLAFDFIDELEATTSPHAVVEHFGARLQSFGFHAFLITGLPAPGRRIDPYVLLNGWPADWFERYTEQNFIHKDPIARNCYSTIDPFEWADVTGGRRLEGESQRVMDEATEFNMTEGFVVPIFDAFGFQAAVTMAGRDLDLPGKSKPAIHLMAIYAHSIVQKLMRQHLPDESAGAHKLRFAGLAANPLTEREQEILRWTALGKTGWEISRILSISEKTVNEHRQNARAKLDAATTTHAVAEAILHRFIRL